MFFISFGGRFSNLDWRGGFAGLFGGVEEENDDEGFIIAMTEMIFEEGWCEGGLVSISGIMLFLPFICLKVKVYCENHCDHLNSWAFGMVFFFKLSI